MTPNEQIAELMRLADDYAYKYSFVGDFTIPRSRAALEAHARKMVEGEPVALPNSYSSGTLVSDSAGFTKVTLHFADAQDAEKWFNALAVVAPQPAPAPQAEVPQAEVPPLSTCEQKAVLADLMGLECLINYHDCQETGADAIEPGAGRANEKRALELLAIGRAIIADDPDIWRDEQKSAFKLRYGEALAAKEQS